ncbi:GNAT family N-acetyltransferase [Paenibacillus barengoltzii]|uniref:GNAT family N-acetyltransferase n=1 Tax=Paenibacillus barengoltzii TaxID=343517 RepID=UPI002DBC7F0E|nr:GNAT family N-acetyltransferase [Paenibacillus barengoltzii]MEC2343727.1 GNAT family N-acetyltransferase [Paenibacillus barengoltzii]
MKIRLLENHEEVPLDLLLLADPSQEMIAEYLQRGQCYVGLDEREQIIAVIVLLPTRPGTLEIINIAVREAFQGRGIGKKLIQFAMDQAREKNAKTIEIGTGNSSVGQLLLYQKCGFRITGIDRDFFIRHYPEKIYENGIQCRDMIRLSLDLFE